MVAWTPGAGMLPGGSLGFSGQPSQIGVFDVKVRELVSGKPNTAARSCADFPSAVIKFWPKPTQGGKGLLHLAMS